MVKAGAMAQQVRSRLLLLRIAWCTVAFLTLGLVVISILNVTTSLGHVHLIVICDNCNNAIPMPPRLRLVQLNEPWLAGYTIYSCILCVIFTLSYFLVAGVLAWRKSDDRMALFAAFFLALMAVTFCNDIPTLASPWSGIVGRATYLGITCLFLFFYLFPTGRFVPWWSCGLAVVAFFYWGSYILFLRPPLGDGLLNILVEYGLVGSIAVVQIYRYKRLSNPVQKRKTRWVVFGGTGAAFVYLLQQEFVRLATAYSVSLLLRSVISNTLFFFSLLLIPLSIGVAILRSRLWNIDIIIHRTLLYITLSVCVVGLYVLLVGGMGMLFQEQGNVLTSLLATGLIAVLFHPLRERLQQAVNYLVYGGRSNPYQVLSHLSQRLETTLIPEAVLPTIVETVATAFKLPYVAITLEPEGEHIALSAAYGEQPQGGTLLRFSLTYQGEFLGELILSSESLSEVFSSADLHLLKDLTRQAGIALHAARLSADIQRSRERLVTTREEERRRLRRDLHDGLGPQLASLMLLLTAVRKTLRREPEIAENMLVEAMSHMQEAIADIRHLVYGLRPPALDDLGLLAVLQEDMQRYRASGIIFVLDAPDPLPPLPAAVEVACYRIAQEALTNVVNHAQATHCTLRLSINDELKLEVSDDGKGFTGLPRAGVGLTSMRERALELGGTCNVDTHLHGGTRLSVCLPLR